MKTILRIIIILLAASTVAGAFFLIVNNGTTISSSENGQPPATTSANGQTMPVMERPEEGDHDSGSVAGGISGVLVTLAKLTGITLVMLSLEKGLELLTSRKRNWSQG